MYMVDELRLTASDLDYQHLDLIALVPQGGQTGVLVCQSALRRADTSPYLCPGGHHEDSAPQPGGWLGIGLAQCPGGLVELSCHRLFPSV
jgi:hypothetical protein